MRGIRRKPVRPRFPFHPSLVLFLVEVCSNEINRFGNSTCPSLRNPQIVHLHPGPSHNFNDTESREGPTRLGMGHRKADDEGGESDQAGYDPGFETAEKEVISLAKSGNM
jgi:hypothetical protein